MERSSLTHDPLWPRASEWLRVAGESHPAPHPGTPRPPSAVDLTVLGVPAHLRSITPTGADRTPAAVRAALARYSTFAASRDVDISRLRALDLGDVDDPDGAGGLERIADAAAGAARICELLVAIGGDNSITFPLMRGVFGAALPKCGLITIDAHHDLRDGESNGSPVRRLVEAGLPGSSIAQIGIADFSNSADYARRAREWGIRVITRADVRGRVAEAVAEALDAAGADGRRVFVDVDLDVCDRAAVPGCPSAAPGGIGADELREMVYLLARDGRVRGIDLTEVDATADAEDQRTVRLAALLVLEAAAGLASREGRAG